MTSNQKIRVLLVDDEYLAIEDLMDMVSWDSLGFTIVGTASSGRQALEKLRNLQIDMLITDISMPGMDGITLIERIKPTRPNIHFLLLTAYEDVGYMKRALHIGVEDYLIKDEITPESLSEKLRHIRNKYTAHSEQTYSYLQKSLHSYFSSRDNLTPEIPTSLNGGRFYHCLLISDDLFLPLIRAASQDPFDSLPQISTTEQVLQFIEQFEYHPVELICSFSIYNNEILTLFCISQMPDELSESLVLRDFCSSLIEGIRANLHVDFSCFYSTSLMHLPQIKASLSQTIYNVRARYFMARQTVLPLDSGLFFIDNSAISFSASDISTHLQTEDFHTFETWFLGLWKHVKDMHMYMGLFQLISGSLQFLKQSDHALTIDGMIADKLDINQLAKHILSCFKELYQDRIQSSSAGLKKALQYIDSHYGMEKLSVQEVADVTGFSVNHFSRIFKKETGDTFVNYLTGYRIQKACELLAGTDKKIYEIAEEVGYSTPQYFSQVFIKYKKMTPLEYRKKGPAHYEIASTNIS